ncbi:MAG: ABC transporter substrate-binding protein [Gemmatimonadota bacterium]
MRRTRLGGILLSLLALAACGAGEGGGHPPALDAITLVDAAGDTLTLPTPAQRVISLVPSATLTLDALGARALLVGRTDYDTVAWAAKIPSVGGGLHPSLEATVALHPDLVIRFAGPQDPDTPRRLRELGIAQLAVRPDRIADIFETIRLVGRAVGKDAQADSLADALGRSLDALGREAKALPGPPPRVAFVLGGSPPWVAGPGTYIDELITLAGGVNVFADLEHPYSSVSPEVFLSRRIDVVLTPAPATLDSRLLAGVRVEKVSGSVELPGPNVVEAAREVADKLRQTPPEAS